MILIEQSEKMEYATLLCHTRIAMYPCLSETIKRFSRIKRQELVAHVVLRFV